MDALPHALNALLMLALPLGLALLISRRMRMEWKLFFSGGVVFIVSQLGHVPFNALALNPLLGRLGLAVPHTARDLAAFALLVGLSAGVFEEGARYLMYRLWLRQARSWPQALMLGAGHGGAEAILLGLLAALALVQALIFRTADLGVLLPEDQLALAEQQLAQYWSLTWYESLLGALERAFALTVHLALSVMVLQATQPAKSGWLALAILWHTLVNALAVFSFRSWGALAAEGVIALTALVSLGIILGLRSTRPPEAANPPAGPPTMFGAEIPHLDRGRLEDTRYVDGQ
jgi:uncharacterized membrane protein YhfC